MCRGMAARRPAKPAGRREDRGVMSSELGAWLRQQREARSWAKAEMARRLVQAAREAGDTSVPSADGMMHNIHRWERQGGVSERHKLHYCRALGIQPGQFGPRPRGYPEASMAPGSIAALAVPTDTADVMVPAQATDGIPGLPGPHLPASASIAYRERQEPGLGRLTVEREVLMAAHQGSE